MDRKKKIKSKKDYDRVYQRGRRYSARSCVVLWTNNDLGNNRYGIVVSKKVGKAVERNRARRRLREVIRKMDNRMLQGYDVVVVAKKGAVDMAFVELVWDCERVFKKAGLLMG